MSIWMMLIVVFSTIVWLVYGVAINSGPVIVANSIVFTLSLLLIYFNILSRANVNKATTGQTKKDLTLKLKMQKDWLYKCATQQC